MTNVKKLFIAQGVLGAKRLANERWQRKHQSERDTIKGMSVHMCTYRNKNSTMLISFPLFSREIDLIRPFFFVL